MASSDVAICNLALLRVGVTDTIDSLEAASPEARVCKALYAQARDRLLVERPWPFATRRADLAELADVDRLGWEFAYGVPTDCLRALSIWCGTRAPVRSQRIPFALEGDATHGRVLLTDLEGTEDDPVELTYVAKVTAPALFPPHFVEALAWGLAGDLATALALEERLSQKAMAMYEAALSKAGALALDERDRDEEPESEFIRARD